LKESFAELISLRSGIGNLFCSFRSDEVTTILVRLVYSSSLQLDRSKNDSRLCIFTAPLFSTLAKNKGRTFKSKTKI